MTKITSEQINEIAGFLRQNTQKIVDKIHEKDDEMLRVLVGQGYLRAPLLMPNPRNKCMYYGIINGSESPHKLHIRLNNPAHSIYNCAAVVKLLYKNYADVCKAFKYVMTDLQTDVRMLNQASVTIYLQPNVDKENLRKFIGDLEGNLKNHKNEFDILPLDKCASSDISLGSYASITIDTLDGKYISGSSEQGIKQRQQLLAESDIVKHFCATNTASDEKIIDQTVGLKPSLVGLQQRLEGMSLEPSALGVNAGPSGLLHQLESGVRQSARESSSLIIGAARGKLAGLKQ
jgi:hypothetical protein